MDIPSRVLRIPQNLSLIEAANFCSRMHLYKPKEKLTIDCSLVQHVEPFTMAFVSTEIKRFFEENPEIEVNFVNYDRNTYAAHMGFFRAAGLDYGNAPGEARGGANYIPLTIFKVDDIKHKASNTYEHVGDIVETESSRLSEMLIRENKGELFDTLTFSLREIMRNSVEHAETEIIEICAQYWPTKHKVEIAVLDSGVGVKSSLSLNPYLKINDDRDAVHLALMPGISGKMYKGVKKRANDAWQNSGFGLYMTNRIARNGGSFLLCSGGYGLLLNENGKKDIKINHKGTALRMVIDTSRIGSLSNSLSQYRKEGYRIAQEHAGSDAIEPSQASTMLFRDFKSQD